MPHLVTLRDIEEHDLPTFFAHQRDPLANEMAAFPAREREAFMAHWKKILANDEVMTRTVLVDSAVAGNVVCFEQSSRWLIGYWIGREFWGRGVATRAVSDFVASIPTRPLHAFVARHNVASRRVLEKCGFAVEGECRTAAATAGDAVDECIYALRV